MKTATELTNIVDYDTVEISVDELIPYHGVQDEAKFSDLITSMKANGWQGVPLVKCGSSLLTGSHRYAAAVTVGLEVVPAIDVQDAFCLDYDDICGVDALDLTLMCRDVDGHLADYLGMDIH